MVEITTVGDREELGRVFDLLGAQGTPGLDTSDFRFADLDAHFPHDQPLMLIASTEGQPVGGALAFRNDHGVVVLRVIAVIDARHLAHVGGGVVVPARSEGNKADHRRALLENDGAGSRKIGPGQAPTPVFASPLDRQAVEVGVGDQAPIRAPPAVDMNGGDRLGVLSCGNTNVHGPRMTDVERRPARYFGL